MAFPHITSERGATLSRRRDMLAPDAETLHPDGKLQEQRWHNLHAAIDRSGVICRYANKVVPVVLPDTIDTCVWDDDERRVHCF